MPESAYAEGAVTGVRSPPLRQVLLEGLRLGGDELAGRHRVDGEHLVVRVAELVEADVAGDTVEVGRLDVLGDVVTKRLAGLAGAGRRQRLDDRHGGVVGVRAVRVGWVLVA